MPERSRGDRHDRIDRTDARLLERLQVDGRRPYADLGADVGIRGYAASVDPAAAGYGITAFSWLTQAPGTPGTDLTDAFAGIPEVEECHHIAGEADYLLKIRARDTRHLEAVIVRLQAITSVFTSETDIVLSTAFERRPLRLVEADETDGP